MPHRYPAEVRFQVIELARSGTKVAQLAETFGIHHETLRKWVRGYQSGTNFSGPGPFEAQWVRLEAKPRSRSTARLD